MATPKAPRELISRQLTQSRGLDRPGFVRQTYRLERAAARNKARDWFEKFPKAAYWTQVESWRVLENDMIEFTMRRLPTAD